MTYTDHFEPCTSGLHYTESLTVGEPTVYLMWIDKAGAEFANATLVPFRRSVLP